jgi:flavin reductase (DIM6/NTAB) family NADH-FMN oxidoreductase RutF
MAATADKQTAGRTAFSGQEFRQAAGTFATGVTVVTSRDGEHGYGMTANSFSSVSLDPPLVLVCVIARTEGSAVIERHGNFAVNILAADQEPISRYFASKDRPRGAEAFRDVSHKLGVTGCPIIDGVAGHLDCTLVASHEAGDHVIFVGEVKALDLAPDAQPLIFHGGGYRLLRQRGESSLSAIHAVPAAR